MSDCISRGASNINILDHAYEPTLLNQLENLANMEPESRPSTAHPAEEYCHKAFNNLTTPGGSFSSK